MAAAAVDLFIEAGATFERTVMWSDPAGAVIPLTGYSARMQVRESYDAPVALITLTSAVGGGLTITALSGEVAIRIGADLTAGLVVRKGVYDLELHDITDPTQVIRLMAGVVTVSAEVTKP